MAPPTSATSLTRVPGSSTARPLPSASAGATRPCTAEVRRFASRRASHRPRPTANKAPKATQAMARYRSVVTRLIGAPAATVQPDSDDRLNAV
ncbi:hypothetical protein D9M72_238530 [compost metagenome]